MELHHFVTGIIGAMDVSDPWTSISTILRYVENILTSHGCQSLESRGPFKPNPLN
jgi:hypothetical protein